MAEVKSSEVTLDFFLLQLKLNENMCQVDEFHPRRFLFNVFKVSPLIFFIRCEVTKFKCHNPTPLPSFHDCSKNIWDQVSFNG